MNLRFKQKSEIFDIGITVISAFFSVGTMIYGVLNLGLKETWPELVLNMFYIASLVMMWMYFFKFKITTMQFNYWCTLCVGATVLLRDIMFPPKLSIYPITLACRALSVLLILMLTYFYARKDWKMYSKRNLWMICIVDMVLAALYMVDIYLEPSNQYTEYMLTEIWIRPSITYGLVACYVSGKEEGVDKSKEA